MRPPSCIHRGRSPARRQPRRAAQQLIVDTTNFGKSQFRGSGENLHLIERFTRTAVDTLIYEFTVDDPASYVRPWTARITMIPSPIFENACHEGNYALAFILGTARFEERNAR